jgi:hypothetical protein
MRGKMKGKGKKQRENEKEKEKRRKRKLPFAFIQPKGAWGRSCFPLFLPTNYCQVAT